MLGTCHQQSQEDCRMSCKQNTMGQCCCKERHNKRHHFYKRGASDVFWRKDVQSTALESLGNTSNCCSYGFYCILAENAVTHPFLPAHWTRHCSITERAPLLDVGHDGVDGFHWHLRRKSMREAGTNQYWRMDFNLNS